MAKVKIQGHASGTGILTVTAPNTSTDRTITLPDATGTLLNSDGSGASLTALNATQLTSGTVPTARLGSGTANSSVHLRGDGTWAAAGTTYAGIDDQSSSNDDQLTIKDTEVVINEDSDDLDFRVESNGNANMLMVDASTDRIGIGIASPGVQFANIAGTGTNIGAGGINWNNSEASKYVAQFRNGADPGWGISVKLGMSAPDATDKYIDFLDDEGVIQASFTGTGEASGGLAIHTNGSERMRIAQDGKIGIAITDSPYTVEVGDSGGGRGWSVNLENNSAKVRSRATANDTQTHYDFEVQGVGNVGTIKTVSGATQYNTSSDYRLKENVDYDWDATTRLKQLKPARFNWISDDTNTLIDGFLAHEVSSVVPLAVSGEKDAVIKWQDWEEMPEGVSAGDNKLDDSGNTIIDTQGIDPSKLVPLLVKTIQELEARITAGGL